MDATTATLTVLRRKPVVVYVGTGKWGNLREKILNSNAEDKGTRSPEGLNSMSRLRSN